MEDYAVVLANDLVVKASNFGGIPNLKFNKQGKVVSFLYENKTYIALFNFGSNEFLDYSEESNFYKQQKKEVYKEGDKYDGVTKKLWESFVFKKYDKLVKAQFNDTIYGLLRDSSGLCYNKFTWIYTNPYKGPVNPQKASNAYSEGKSCETFADGTHAKDFFDAYKNQTFYDTNQNDIRLIGEIASLLKNAGEKTTEAFLNFNLTGVDTTKFTFHTTENQLSRAELLEYKKGLELWLKMLKKYQSEISKLGHDEQLFIAIDVMYRHNMLTLLTPQQRINILKILAEKGPLMNWYWEIFSIGFVHKEDLAIKILESFTNNADADLFLKKLVSTNVVASQYRDEVGVTHTSTTTLYKLLFYRMDDYGGKDNFTKFVQELQRIVLLKNNIVKADIPPTYSKTQLTAITEAQFIWREKQPEKGPKVERVKYEIVSNTDKKIKFKETKWLKTRLEPFYTTNSVGVDVITGYTETPVLFDDPHFFELNHFDLVSIHFYNNPSFVDLSENVTYVERHFFTFAGFVDYVLEKERTKVAEDIFNATLFAISLTIGFGELVAAIRSVNVARAVLGLAMITSDSAAYLVGTTAFHNYIINTYGSARGNKIIGDLTILTTIASLGTNAIAGSGILKAYSREEALKLVGTGEAILKDSVALEKLTSTEIAALEEAIKKIKKELYAIRNVPEAVETIVNTKANVLFNKFENLENALNNLTEINRNAFRFKFVNLSEKEIDILRTQWLGYKDVERLEIIQNSDIWIKNIKLRQYLKDERYDLISMLYNKPISDAYIHNGYRYNILTVDVTDEILSEFDKAILIANRTDDVAIIANKLELSEDVIQKVKDHLFKNEYFLLKDDGSFSLGRLERFPSSGEPPNITFGDSDLWNHFIDNDLSTITIERQKEFKWLIAHEYIEASLMEKHMPLRSFIDGGNMKSYDVGAHYISVNSNSNWDITPYSELGRLLENIPPLPNENLDNLDIIVSQLINFYKLE